MTKLRGMDDRLPNVLARNTDHTVVVAINIGLDVIRLLRPAALRRRRLFLDALNAPTMKENWTRALDLTCDDERLEQRDRQGYQTPREPRAPR